MSEKEKLKCGIIMPISPSDDYTENHWVEVKQIIEESVQSIKDYSFDIFIVSDSEYSGLIHKTIVQNIYDSDIVVCDVSNKNPNVMFELGMRLAFDKPTIIIKDTNTSYSFDTGGIEHLEYPRDLRFQSIVEFKKKLASKITATYKNFTDDPEHSTFLKSFGNFKVIKLTEEIVSGDKAVIEAIHELSNDISRLRRDAMHTKPNKPTPSPRVRMRNAIRHWIGKHKYSDVNSLLNDSNFVEYVEDRINAPKLFGNKEDFLDALEAEAIDLLG